MTPNFDAYAVFVPGSCEGITMGYDLVKVLATSPQDAINKACEVLFGNSIREGTFIVALERELTAFDVGEKRVPDVLAQVSLP